MDRSKGARLYRRSLVTLLAVLLAGNLLVSARIYSGESLASSVGQFAPFSVGPETANWRLLTFSGENRRTNLGILNRSSSNHLCSVKSLDGAVSTVVGIPAESVIQWNLASLLEEDLAAYRIECDGPVFVYASSVDNLSQDAVFTPAFVTDGRGFRW